jgi:23S rRNA pseudouridine1911/1915/1917 synthase
MNGEWVVAPGDAGVRLDKFLAAPDRAGSRGRAASALERGKVIVNGSDVDLGDAARRLAAGDVIRLWMDRPGTSKSRRPTVIPAFHIVYEDDDLYVIDKPAGLLAVPLPIRDAAPSVYQLLLDHLHARGKRRVFVVHRIDRDTSGLVVFAKGEQAQLHLKAQLRRREPERVYLAVVYGHPDPLAGTWRDRLVWDDAAVIQKETHPQDPRGTEAISHYRVLESMRDTSLVEVRLHTGKRNQIRLQARLHGHTLVGERRYVYGPDRLRPIEFGRQALHAFRLAFVHPRDGRTLRFEAQVPNDMKQLIDQLRLPGSGIRAPESGT